MNARVRRPIHTAHLEPGGQLHRELVRQDTRDQGPQIRGKQRPQPPEGPSGAPAAAWAQGPPTQNRLQHSGENMRAAGVGLHPARGEHDDIGVSGKHGQDSRQRILDRGIGVHDGGLHQAKLAGVDSITRRREGSEEPVPGDVGGGHRDPDEVEALPGQGMSCHVGGAARGGASSRRRIRERLEPDGRP